MRHRGTLRTTGAAEVAEVAAVAVVAVVADAACAADAAGAPRMRVASGGTGGASFRAPCACRA